MKFTKKDLLFSIITGLTTGVIAWRILNFLGVSEFHFGASKVVCGIVQPCFTIYSYSISWFWLVIIVPILWIVGVNLGYFLGRWMNFFNQFGKYAAVGFTNAAVDFGILNLLIAWTGIAGGVYYTLFKISSVAVAVIHSYIWNRFWVFQSTDNQNRRAEFAKFLGVNIVAILVNVGVASFVVNFINPLFGLDAKVWANIGAVAGSAVALTLTFVGLKLAVFKQSSKN